MTAPRSFAPLLLFLALAGAAVAQPPVAPAVMPSAPAPADAAPPLTAAKEVGKSLPPVAGAKPTVPPLSPRFQLVRSRIDALFRHRNEAPPPADSKANPFRGSVGAVSPAGAGTSAGGTGAGPALPPAPPVNPEMQQLQLAASALKVAGVIQINGRDHLIINQAPYKEGDVIIARAKGQPVYLRLKVISRFTFTLTYNDSELAVKY